MNKKNSNKKFVIGITVAVLLPFIFFLITKLMSKDTIHLPAYFIADSIVSVPKDGKLVSDTIFHKVADIQLTNQLGDHISINNDLPGKILVVDLFFTTCPTVCPKLTGNMTLLQKAFRKSFKYRSFDTSVHLISLTV